MTTRRLLGRMTSLKQASAKMVWATDMQLAPGDLLRPVRDHRVALRRHVFFRALVCWHVGPGRAEQAQEQRINLLMSQPRTAECLFRYRM